MTGASVNCSQEARTIPIKKLENAAAHTGAAERDLRTGDRAGGG